MVSVRQAYAQYEEALRLPQKEKGHDRMADDVSGTGISHPFVV